MWEKLKGIYQAAAEKVIEVEGAFKGKTGAEKRDSVVEYLAGLFNLSFIPDFIETPAKRLVFGYVVDMAVEKLNWITGWDFAGVSLDEEQAGKLAEAVTAPVAVMSRAMAALPEKASLDDRLNALYESYKVGPAQHGEAAAGSGPDEPKVSAEQQNWDKAIAFTMKWEGGYVNDPDDKGGETNMGITKGALTAAYAQGLVTHCDVKALTKDEAKAIYKANYWDKYGWGEIPWPACAALFDTTVNHGGGGMARLVQRTANDMGLNLEVDGKFGPQTSGAIKGLAFEKPVEFAAELLSQRKEFYDDIISVKPSQEKFRRGWYNRLDGLAKACGAEYQC